MKTRLSRLKLTLILTVAICLPTFWVLVLSSSPLLVSLGIPVLLAWGLLSSFASAYAVTLYVSAIRQGDEKRKP